MQRHQDSKTAAIGKKHLRLFAIRRAEAVAEALVAKTILITGAGSDLGRSMAEALAQRGHRVFASMREPFGRNRDAANRLWARGIDVLELDVACEDAARAAVELVSRKAGRLDVLLNNARQSTFGPVSDSPPEQIEHAFNVGLAGAVRASQAVLFAMREGGSGLIVNIGSVQGRTALPSLGIRGAVGSALEALTDAMRLELKGTGIDVVLVQRAAIGSIEELGPAPESSNARDPSGLNEMCQAVVSLVDLPAGLRPLRMTVGAAAEEAPAEIYPKRGWL